MERSFFRILFELKMSNFFRLRSHFNYKQFVSNLRYFESSWTLLKIGRFSLWAEFHGDFGNKRFDLMELAIISTFSEFSNSTNLSLFFLFLKVALITLHLFQADRPKCLRRRHRQRLARPGRIFQSQKFVEI